MRKILFLAIIISFIALISMNLFKLEAKEMENFVQIFDQNNIDDNIKGYIEGVKDNEGIYQMEDLYIIALGPKPNSGYGIKYVKEELRDKTLKVYLEKTTPAPDMFYAQVISYPCLVLKISSPIEDIEFIDIKTNQPLTMNTTGN